MKLPIALLIILATNIASQARPVSFVGGKTAIVSHDANESSALFHHTIDPKASVGFRTIFRDQFRSSINAIELNLLAVRKNGEEHQANLYLRGGIGIASMHVPGQYNSIAPAAYVGMAADWENRRFFTSYQNKIEAIEGHGHKFTQSARVGVAPYIAEYGKLHTWLMLEVNHDHNDPQGAFTVRPIVRLFKGVHLLELGVNNRLEAMVNWIGRY